METEPLHRHIKVEIQVAGELGEGLSHAPCSVRVVQVVVCDESCEQLRFGE